jgi:PAS domain S-box-containing protein
VFVVDRAGRITFASQSAAELTGWPVHQTYGRDFLEAVGAQAGGERVRAAMAQAIAGRASQTAELQVPLPDGSARTFDVAMEMLADNDVEPGVLLRVGRRTSGAGGGRAGPTPAAAARAPALRAFGAGTRMLVYSHDTFGLGHLRRCSALIRSVCARHPDASVLLVTGSPMVHRYAMPQGSDYVKLPALVKVEAEQYEARSLQISSEAIQSLRSSLILHTVRDYRPNVLLVDHSPTGSMGELLPSLRWLQERGGCQRILGLRDIVDDPAAVTALWRRTGVYDVLAEHYDHLVVYGNAAFYDPVRSYELPPAVAARARFVDFVCNDDEVPVDGEQQEDTQPFVLVTIGGGDGGGDTVIEPFLQMMQAHWRRLPFRAEVLTGPFVAPELERRLRALAQGLPVRLQTFIPSTAGLLRRAGLVIATAGYNTTTDVLSMARRALLIPRVLYRQEQWIRARRLQELGLVGCLHPDQVTPDTLFAAVQDAMRDTPLLRARTQGLPLDGARNFAAFCGGLSVRA